MAVSALLTFLSIVVPLVPDGGISATMAREAVGVLVKPIDGEGQKLGVASLRAGVKCIGTLLVGFCDLDDWESIRIGFGSLLKFSIDKRPKVSPFVNSSYIVLPSSQSFNLWVCVCLLSVRSEDALKSVWRSYLVLSCHLPLSRKQVIRYTL